MKSSRPLLPGEAEAAQMQVNTTTIVRFADRAFAQLEDKVMVELPLHVSVNGSPRYLCMRLPGHDRELATGLCFSEGLVTCPDDIESVEPDEAGNLVDVRLAAGRCAEPGTVQLFTSSSGALQDDALERFNATVRPIDRTVRLTPAGLFEHFRDFGERQEVFRQTGGPHGAALYAADGSCIAFAEDIGRHNALDACIGSALLSGRLPDAAVGLLSSRLSYEMVAKACRARLEILAGVSAPTSLAVQIAQKCDLTLVGFARRGAFNIYSAADRLAEEETA